ncbi:peroxisomal membrane protein 11A-like [Carassius carassius]|uniref:peroxisomal membrane protein 11A-like n=1 Tax=Carassius carassius TaxID=217509 RepID=UPI002868734F|nr:peroxisomal membrane protein 11A-like [Carassius carassius]
METYIIFTNQSQGRDRIFRATQYACALAKYLQRNEAKRKELVKKLQFLESNMSSGRKRKNSNSAKHKIYATAKTSKLGIYQTNAGVVGFCGLVSSLLGILSVLRPSLKIKP